MSESETEKQEGQKTVVAFIAGLLIGGLLVWVFSSSPEEQSSVEVGTGAGGGAAAERTLNTNVSNTNTGSDSQRTEPVDSEVSMEADIIRDGVIEVSNQPAGSVVVLDTTTFPTNAGWVVVQDYMDGIPGNILGAARFNETEGLVPQSVNLLRSTESGSTYQVIYYSENGDRVFDLSDDFDLESGSVTFTAE